MLQIMIVVLLTIGLIINIVREFNLVNYQKISLYISKKEAAFLVFIMFQACVISLSLLNVLNTSASLFQSSLFLCAFLTAFGTKTIIKLSWMDILMYIIIPFLVFSGCISVLRYYNITTYINFYNIVMLSYVYMLIQFIIFQKSINHIIMNEWEKNYENKNN